MAARSQHMQQHRPQKLEKGMPSSHCVQPCCHGISRRQQDFSLLRRPQSRFGRSLASWKDGSSDRRHRLAFMAFEASNAVLIMLQSHFVDSTCPDPGLHWCSPASRPWHGCRLDLNLHSHSSNLRLRRVMAKRLPSTAIRHA